MAGHRVNFTCTAPNVLSGPYCTMAWHVEGGCEQWQEVLLTALCNRLMAHHTEHVGITVWTGFIWQRVGNGCVCLLTCTEPLGSVTGSAVYSFWRWILLHGFHCLDVLLISLYTFPVANQIVCDQMVWHFSMDTGRNQGADLHNDGIRTVSVDEMQNVQCSE